MANEGYVSLDLVITADIEKQFEKICSDAEKPAKKLGESIGSFISETIENSSVSIPDIQFPTPEIPEFKEKIKAPTLDIPKADMSEAEKVPDELDRIIAEANKRYYEPLFDAQLITGPVEAPESESKNKKEFTNYDPIKIQAEIDEDISKKFGNIDDEIRETIGRYEIPTDPVELLEKEIENTKEKIELLQKKWQELSAADPSDAISSQIQKIQSKMISTGKTISRLEEKLSKLKAADIGDIEGNFTKKADRISNEIEGKFGGKKVEIPIDVAGDFTKKADKISNEIESKFGGKKIEIPIDVEGNFTEKADKISNEIESKFDSSSKAASKKIEDNISGAFNRVKANSNNAIKGVASGFDKLSAPLMKLKKNIAAAFKSIFVMAALYTAFRALKNGFSEAVLADEKFSASLDEIKMNLSVAFMPVIQTVIPILNSLMSVIAKATKAVASFISGLFGTTYKQSAEAVKKLKATSDAAKKTKLSMAGIDEMNIISSPDKENENDENKKENTAVFSGDMGAEKAGSKVKKILSDSLESVRKKGSEVFSDLCKWTEISFVPTFDIIWDGLKTETDELFVILSNIFSDIISLSEPLKAYFSGDFTEWLRTCFETYGLIAVGLFDTFNTVFSDLWDLAVFPILSSFIEDGLPVITNFSTQSIKTFGVLFSEIKKIFDMIWNDAAKPILQFIAKMWKDLMESLKAFWDKWGEPIFEKIREAITNCGNTFKKIWDNFLKPFFDKLMEVADKIWTDHLKPLVDNLLDFVGEWINAGLDIYNEFISPVVSWFAEEFGPPLAEMFGWLTDISGEYIGGMIDAVSDIIDALKGVVNFVAGVFTGDWERAWNGISDTFSGIWNAISDFFKTPVNAIIDLINGLVRAVGDGINYIIDDLNNFGFEIPEWLGGGYLGFDLDYLSIPEIPHLANGGLATEPTLAMVGDNKNAKADPEVISPLSKLREMNSGELGEIIELLKIIVELLKSGMNIEIINYLFKGSNEFSREVLKAVRNDRIRRGE